MEIEMIPIKKEWFTTMVYNTLKREGLETLEQVAEYGHRALARCPYIADKTVARMNRILIEHGLSFFDDYNPQ
jgi:DNA-directed RNA polymerase alpha subunit